MAHDEVRHDYHLVNPSPWPLIGTISLFVLAVGAVIFMKGLSGATVPEGEAPGLLDQGSYWVMLVGFGMVIYTMAGWWREVVKESNGGDHTPVVQIGLRYGMILFIVSEIMFFVAWFWSFFEVTIFHSARAGGTYDAISEIWGPYLSQYVNWPPEKIEGGQVKLFDPFHLPLMNTLILLLSGTTVTASHHALQHGNRTQAKNWLLITILLGMCFTGLQAFEYYEAYAGGKFTFSSNAWSNAFFMATGFHGAHVIIGTIFLMVCYFRLQGGGMSEEKHLGFEFAAWYWHFVDVVWLFLFAFVYVTPYLVLGT